MAYSNNIFINCPFDNDYYPLLKSLLFTCLFCELTPKLSETKDGDDIRVRQIQKLIEKSKYSIHDISRILPDAYLNLLKETNKKSKKKTKGKKKSINEKEFLPRFNMPFELGLDLGCKHYSKTDKKCLILEEKQYRYKEVISDIAGQDVTSHDNSPYLLMKSVRNWIYTFNKKSKPKSFKLIWDLFNEFLFDFDQDMKAESLDPNKMWEIPFSELIDIMKEWIKNKNKSLSTK